MRLVAVESVAGYDYPERMQDSATTFSSDLSAIISDGTVVDHDAFVMLYEFHNPALLRFLGARVHGRLSCEDIGADVWVKILSRAHQFDGGNFRAWMFTIARTTLIDAVRTHQRERASSSVDDADVAATDPSAEALIREEELAALQDCIQNVGGPFIEAIVRTKLGETSPEQLSEELGISRATVDSRVSRGRKLLSDCIEGKQKSARS